MLLLAALKEEIDSIKISHKKLTMKVIEYRNRHDDLMEYILEISTGMKHKEDDLGRQPELIKVAANENK
jgi:hypothetical protein